MYSWFPTTNYTVFRLHNINKSRLFLCFSYISFLLSANTNTITFCKHLQQFLSYRFILINNDYNKCKDNKATEKYNYCKPLKRVDELDFFLRGPFSTDDLWDAVKVDAKLLVGSVLLNLCSTDQVDSFCDVCPVTSSLISSPEIACKMTVTQHFNIVVKNNRKWKPNLFSSQHKFIWMITI